MEQPLLGVMPLWCHNELRLEALQAAVYRFIERGKAIPEEWLLEAADLIQWIDNRNKTQKLLYASKH